MHVTKDKQIGAGIIAFVLGAGAIAIQRLEADAKKKKEKVGKWMKPMYIVLSILAVLLLIFAVFGNKLNSSEYTTMGSPSNSVISSPSMGFGFRFY